MTNIKEKIALLAAGGAIVAAGYLGRGYIEPKPIVFTPTTSGASDGFKPDSNSNSVTATSTVIKKPTETSISQATSSDKAKETVVVIQTASGAQISSMPTQASTPSQTESPTRIPTATHIPALTEAATNTSTATQTSTPTRIPTKTAVPSPVPTASATRVATQTPDLTRTPTPTRTPTLTSTRTPVRSATATTSRPPILPSPSPTSYDATGKFCGGIAANLPQNQCPTGYTCRKDGNYPDAGGTCVKNSPFSIPGLPDISIPDIFRPK